MIRSFWKTLTAENSRKDGAVRNLRDAGWKTPAAAEWADYRLYLQPTRMLCGERIKPEKVEIYEGWQHPDRCGRGSRRKPVPDGGGKRRGIPWKSSAERNWMRAAASATRCAATAPTTRSGRSQTAAAVWNRMITKGFRYAKLLPGKGVNICGIFVADTPLSDGGGRRGDVLRKAAGADFFHL